MPDKVSSELRTQVAERINEIFERLEMKLPEIAAAISVDQKNFARWRSGETLPNLEHMFRLLEFARETLWIVPDLLGPRLEMDSTYAIRRTATEFLHGNPTIAAAMTSPLNERGRFHEWKETKHSIEYERCPGGLLNGLREIEEKFPIGKGHFQVVDSRVKPLFFFSGARPGMRLEFDVQGMGAIREAVLEAGLVDGRTITSEVILDTDDPGFAARKRHAARIRSLRNRLGMTVEELAEVVEVSSTTVLRWESERDPSFSSLESQHRLSQFAKEEAWIQPDLFGASLEPVRDFSLVRFVTEFLALDPIVDQIKRDRSLDPVVMNFSSAPLGFYETARQLASHISATAFEVDGPQETPLFSRCGPKVGMQIRINAEGVRRAEDVASDIIHLRRSTEQSKPATRVVSAVTDHFFGRPTYGASFGSTPNSKGRA